METMPPPTALYAARTLALAGRHTLAPAGPQAGRVPGADAVVRSSFSIPDSLFLVVIALIVFGPKRLPEISRKAGKILYEFRKASNDFKFQIEEELRLAEQAERQKQLQAQAAQAQPATPVAISAEETVSAEADSGGTGVDGEAGGTAALAETAGETGVPTIMPPRTGEQVSSGPPRRTAFSSSALTGTTMPESEGAAGLEAAAAAERAGAEGASEELQAEVREEIREAEAARAEESFPAYAAAQPSSPNHHG
jgi:sec-independent protein translocase protein TatB